MAKVRVEWVVLGATRVLIRSLGTPGPLTVGGTATTAGSRPVAPANPNPPSKGQLYARVSVVEGNVIAAWGADPTAAQDNGVLIMAGWVEVLPVASGEKLSFIELA